MKTILLIIIFSLIPTLTFSKSKDDIWMGMFYGSLGSLWIRGARNNELKSKRGDKEPDLDKKAQTGYFYASVALTMSGYHFWKYFSEVSFMIDKDKTTLILSRRF